MSTQATLVTSAIIAALMTIPPYLFGAIDPMQAAIAGGYSFFSAAVVCLLAPELAKFTG